jgi:DNA relaxase NicK
MKAKSKKLFALVDWFQFRITNVRIDEISDFLGIPDEVWTLKKAGLAGYQDFKFAFEFSSIKLYTNAYTAYDKDGTCHTFNEINQNQENEFDVMVQFSGQACRFVEDVLFRVAGTETSSFSWKDFFNALLFTYPKIDIRRLDLNINDVNEPQFFTPNTLLKYCETGRFKYGKSVKYSNIGTPKTGQTVYFGDWDSDRQIKCYDKKAEKEAKSGVIDDSYDSWTRLEIKFMRELSSKVIKDFIKSDWSILGLIQGYLKKSLHFYSDREQTKEPQFWTRYLGASEPKKFVLHKKKTTLIDKFSWLTYRGSLPILKAYDFLGKNGLIPLIPSEIWAISNNGLDLAGKDVQTAQFTKDLSAELIAYVISEGRSDLVNEIKMMTSDKMLNQYGK